MCVLLCSVIAVYSIFVGFFAKWHTGNEEELTFPSLFP